MAYSKVEMKVDEVFHKASSKEFLVQWTANYTTQYKFTFSH